MTDIVELLREKVVKFSYYKNDGTLRIAYGTLNSDVIDVYAPAFSGKRRDSDRQTQTVPYFDIVANAWRSFRPDRLVDIDEDYGDCDD